MIVRYTSCCVASSLAICLGGLASAPAEASSDKVDVLVFIVSNAEAGNGAATTEAPARAEVAQASESTKLSPRSARALTAPAGSSGLKALVARHAAANGVPFGLADAVVRIESRYNPRASNAGNYGLMQIRHQTARGMGYGGSAGGLLDAETNVRFGMKYLAQAYRLAGGDTCRTIMKYQSGHMAVRMSGANRTYCAKVRTISASN